ncbi:MAG: abscisic acid-deficient protein Aba4 family protein [Gemmatirosa sp.]
MSTATDFTAALFAAANAAALAAWLLLAGTLFVPRTRSWGWRATGLVLPALFAVVYVVALVAALRGGATGGFGSIGEVRALFADDRALTAGWVHYLAFDLFVGTWIAREGVRSGVPRLLLLPCLALTFLVGPVGLLAFLALRALRAGTRPHAWTAPGVEPAA